MPALGRRVSPLRWTRALLVVRFRTYICVYVPERKKRRTALNNRHKQNKLPHSPMPMLPIATEAANPNTNRTLNTPLPLPQHAPQMLRARRSLPFLGAVLEVHEQLLGSQTLHKIWHRARVARLPFPFLLAVAADGEVRQPVGDHSPAIFRIDLLALHASVAAHFEMLKLKNQ